MLFTYEMLIEELSNYKAPENKIDRLCKDKNIIRLTKNLYESTKVIPGYLVANAIYSPSYLSFDYALSFYGLIPERVFTYTSATFEKNKKKLYKNDLGTFSYRDVPSRVYPFGIKIIEENNYVYAIATPEKALCDKLFTLKPCKNKKEMNNLLFNDLRIDKDKFLNLNFDDLLTLCQLYKTTNHKLLSKIIGDIR